MPILESTYHPSFFFRQGHFATLYPNFFRKVDPVFQHRERIALADDDFIDLDWSFRKEKTDRLMVLVHGLEGNTKRAYMLGLAKQLKTHGWEVVAINLRNCSGQPNRQFRSYSAGVTEDLDAVITHILKTYPYTVLGLCGFSLGGNLVLKYLGEPRERSKVIKVAAAISAPCDLYDSLQALNRFQNKIYVKKFLRQLKIKLLEKQVAFPERIAKADINACRSLFAIDDLYTSKAHGYKDAMEYYALCSSHQFLEAIDIPTLILNAKNDSFLGPKCYPIAEAQHHKYVHLEMPKYGGHVGFYLPNGVYYHEERIVAFCEAYV